MDLRRAVVETEADRLLGVYEYVRLLARERQLGLLAAGAEAVRSGTVAPEDWRRVREAIRRVGDGAAGRPGAAASGSSGFGPGTPPPGNTSPSPE
jgi:hypothetical protein